MEGPIFLLELLLVILGHIHKRVVGIICGHDAYIIEVNRKIGHNVWNRVLAVAVFKVVEKLDCFSTAWSALKIWNLDTIQ